MRWSGQVNVTHFLAFVVVFLVLLYLSTYYVMADDHDGVDELNVSIHQLEIADNNSVSQVATTSSPNASLNTAMHKCKSPDLNTASASQIDNFVSQQLHNIPLINPFKGLTNISSGHKPTATTVLRDITEFIPRTPEEGKRKRVASSVSSIEQIDGPPNPAERDFDKRVSFSLQANNNTGGAAAIQPPVPIPDEPVPPALSVTVAEGDPARSYQVIAEAEKMWKLALDELRFAARAHSRLQRVITSLT